MKYLSLKRSARSVYSPDRVCSEPESYGSGAGGGGGGDGLCLGGVDRGLFALACLVLRSWLGSMAQSEVVYGPYEWLCGPYEWFTFSG